jgi:hypothetical protein
MSARLAVGATFRVAVDADALCGPIEFQEGPEERNMTRLMCVVAVVAASAGMLLWPVLSHAQSDYPNRPVKLIVGFAPGGSTDIVARIMAQ